MMFAFKNKLGFYNPLESSEQAFEVLKTLKFGIIQSISQTRVYEHNSGVYFAVRTYGEKLKHDQLNIAIVYCAQEYSKWLKSR